MLAFCEFINYGYWLSIYRNIGFQCHGLLRKVNDVQSVPISSGNVLSVFIDEFELQLTAVVLGRFHYGPSEKTVSALAEGTLVNGVSSGTVVVPEEPLASLKADIFGIIKDDGFKIAGIVLVGDVVQNPRATK